jgi:hypothetical protein
MQIGFSPHPWCRSRPEWSFAAAVAGLLLALAPGVRAQSVVTLSRGTVDLGAGSWVELGRMKRSVATIERRGDLMADVVASALVDRDRLRAVVIVTSTPTGAGPRVNWGGSCTARSASAWSTPLKGGHPEDLECAEATGPLDAEAMLDSMKLRERVLKHAASVPSEMVAVSADVSTRFGRMMSVELWVDPAFAGLTDVGLGQVPAPVNPAHAAYAVELGQRVRGSLFSIREKMLLPPITFAGEPARDR